MTEKFVVSTGRAFHKSSTTVWKQWKSHQCRKNRAYSLLECRRIVNKSGRKEQQLTMVMLLAEMLIEFHEEDKNTIQQFRPFGRLSGLD